MKIKKGPLKQRNKNAAYNLVKDVVVNRHHLNTFIKNARRVYKLRNNNGVLQGFAFLGNNNPMRGEVILQLIGTAPGKGYGRALMEHIQHKAFGRNIKTIVIHEPVAQARKFYTRIGATPVQKAHSTNTTLMNLLTAPKRNRSPSPTSRTP